MARTVLLIVLTMAALGFAIRGEILRLEIGHLRQELGDAKIETARMRAQIRGLDRQQDDLQGQLGQERALLDTQAKEAQTEIQRLQLVRAETRGKIEQLDGKITALQAAAPIAENDLGVRLKSAQETVKNLEERSKNVKGFVAQVGANSHQALAQRNQQANFERERLREQTRAQEAVVKESQNQLNSWRKQRRDPNQNIRVQEAITKLEADRTVLERLRQERIALDANQRQGAEAIQNQAGLEKQELKDSREQIAEQQRRAKADVEDLNRQIVAEGKTRSDHRAEIQKAQAERAQELAHLQNIDDEIRLKSPAAAKP